jgi:hypothetical protein
MTAVEWFAMITKELGYVYEAQFQQAKEMEKKQLIDFHIEVMKKGLEYEKEKEWSDEYLPLIKERAEQYYKETFKQHADKNN